MGVTLWVAIAIGNAEAARTIEDLAQLRTAMMSRACIGQAKGILMERHKIKEEKAFTILTPTSQRTNTKLRDVAAELVRTGGCAVPVDTLHVQQDWTTTSLRISSPAGFAVTEPNSPSGPRQRRPACCGFRRRSYRNITERDGPRLRGNSPIRSGAVVLRPCHRRGGYKIDARRAASTHRQSRQLAYLSGQCSLNADTCASERSTSRIAA